MPFSLTDLLTPVERDEMVTELLSVAASVGAPTTSWQEGDPILTLLMTVGQKLSDLSKIAINITKGGFGDLLPSDEWADLWAQSRFNVVRVAATQAIGLVTLTNSSLTQYDLQPGDLIVAHATTGKTYRNTSAISILASVGLANVTIAADEPGTASNAAPSTITVVVSSLPGVGCSNPASLLGTDKEDTPHLVARARAKLGALSPNGAKDAYNFIATTPDFSPTSSPITRTRTVADPATGFVTVYLATASGAPIAGDVAIVQTAIDNNVEPWAVTATAVAATPHTIAVTYQAWVKGSQLTPAQIQTAIGNALATFFSTLPLGGFVIPPDTGAVYVGQLEQVIGTAAVGIIQSVVTLPAGTVTLTPNEVAVLGTIIPTITIL